MKNNKIAVMASGNGSNLKVILKAIAKGECAAQVEVVICNKADAKALNIAKGAGVSHVYFMNPKDYEDREAYDIACAEIIQSAGCVLIVLAGYMRILSASFIHAFPKKIINIHPSLLPAFKGADAVGEALKAGVKVSGCTVHYVTEALDSGQILAQACVPVLADDDWHALHQRIQTQEHIIYIEVINSILNN
ncbi:MAG: phosphoribosylglycinamide formyltransferase [Ghiorsea sp.]|nr:phosphoribosylglycinamide formyltransferase [Ghiorsea sp.]